MIPVERLATVDSTSAEAARRAAATERGPIWLQAEVQTAGKGRAGRTWVSDRGNLAATLLLTVRDDPAHAALHSFAACLAVADALDGFVGPPERLSLKWPNDVLLDDRKIAGVLLESGIGGGERWLSIGIGVNLTSAPADTRWPAIALAEAMDRAPPDPPAMLAALSAALEAWIARLDRDGFPPIRGAWLARAARLGETVEARLPRETLAGRFETLDADGAMLLQTGAGRRRIVAADVHFP